MWHHSLSSVQHTDGWWLTGHRSRRGPHSEGPYFPHRIDNLMLKMMLCQMLFGPLANICKKYMIQRSWQTKYLWSSFPNSAHIFGKLRWRLFLQGKRWQSCLKVLTAVCNVHEPHEVLNLHTCSSCFKISGNVNTVASHDMGAIGQCWHIMAYLGTLKTSQVWNHSLHISFHMKCWNYAWQPCDSICVDK